MALAGSSGSGKSTLIGVLLGFITPDAGRVVIEEATGERSLDQLDMRAWRTRVAWVPQDPVLQHGTVESNIRLGQPGAPREAVEWAADRAALHEVELGRPVGEGGSGLSAGQRRRVAVARALLAERPVLLLDEPTAGLDTATEAKVLASVRQLARDGRRVLTVAHRPAVLAAADRVVTLPAPADIPAAACGRALPRGIDGSSGVTGTSLDRAAIKQLTLAVAAGALASVAAIALTATSAWLISRASQRPPVLSLTVAVVAVQAFALARSVFRYLERLVSHDAALRVLATMRVTAYRRLEQLAPAGLPAFRSGDLVSRLVADVDGIADRWLRVVLPYTTAAVAGAATICFAALLLPSAAIVLAVSLVVAAIVAPWAAGNAARQAERRIAPRRGELTVASLDLLRGCSELLAFGAAEAGLDRADAADRALSQAEGRSALGRGIAASVTALAAGASVWACLVLGVPAVRSEALPGVALAVLVLTPLAAHEVFGALAPAAQQLPRIRGSASRVQAVLQQPDPVREPASPLPPPAPPYDLRIEGLSARWDAAGPDVLSGIDLSVPAGRRVAIVGPSGAGENHPGHGAAAVP